MSSTCNHTGPCTPGCFVDSIIHGFFGEKTLPIHNPLWTWNTTKPAPCDHCYCQPGQTYNNVKHNRCHKCNDERMGA